MEWKKYSYEFEGLRENLNRIQQKKEKLDSHRPIPEYAIKSIKDSLSIEWTYNSNSIEGNTLSLNETRLVLQDGLTVKGKSLREHFEAFNHNEAIQYIESLISDKYILTSSDIMKIHSFVLQNIENEIAGRYRTSGVRITNANFTPPNALKVYDLVEELLHWLYLEERELDVVIKATIFHHRFVWIHPYFDGNGRTVRLAFNLILMSEGYPPAIILRNDRKKYYDALNRANNGDYSKLLLMVIQALERSLDIYLSHLENTHEDYKDISDIVSEPEIPYGQEYVSLLARRGKIAAYKEGRNWVTTKDAVMKYMAERKRKRIVE